MSSDNEVKIISYYTQKEVYINPDVEIIRLNPPVWISFFYNFNGAISDSKEIIKRIKSGIKNWIKKLFFPDLWTLGHKKIFNYFKQNHFNKFDYIIASVAPYSNATIALKLKEEIFDNAKVILDIGDPFIYNIVHRRNNKKSAKFEREILNRADKIIVTNKDTKNHYNCTYDFAKEKIAIIEQGVSKSFLEKYHQFEKEPKDNIRLIYAGAFYQNARNPSNFITALKNMNDENFCVDIFDTLNFLPLMNNEFNIYIHSKVKQDQLIPYYKNADLLIYFDNVNGIQTPGKIYELLALKKPILFIYFDKASNIKEKLIKFNHILYSNNDVESISKALLAYKENSQYSFDYNSSKFYWENRANQYKQILYNEG